jgi:hypothetical protein
MAPGRLSLSVVLVDAQGRRHKVDSTAEANDLDQPGRFSEISINALARDADVDEDEIVAFVVFAEPIDGNTPTRINHQLVYSDNALASSINVSLLNPNVFMPETKTGLAWGQIAVGGNLESYLGFAVSNPEGETDTLEITLYDETGEVGQSSMALPEMGGVIIDLKSICGDVINRASGDVPTYLWYWARTQRPDLTGYTVTRHRETGHCTGEHSF